MRLLDKSGNEVQTGTKLTSFRGERYILKGGRPPQHEGSTGKVWVIPAYADPKAMSLEFYPDVFDLHWGE